VFDGFTATDRGVIVLPQLLLDHSNGGEQPTWNFEMDVKTSKAKTPVKDATPITTNKRLDHHLIDQDLELEDKNGRLLNPARLCLRGGNGCHNRGLVVTGGSDG
jgi:hypothetical protein